MKKQREFPFNVFFWSLILFGISLFIFAGKSIFTEKEKIEPAFATMEDHKWKDHAFKQTAKVFKELPYTKLPKHPPSETEKELKETIDSILEHPDLEGAITGISVRDASGNLLYEKNGDVRLIPASNMKIISAVAALEVLGPNYEFTTEIVIDGRINKGTLRGDLYLVGKGALS